MARTVASPILDMPPITSVSPDWYLVGDSHNRTDTGDSHKLLADPVAAYDLEKCLVQRIVLPLQRRARQEHRSGDLLQHRVIGDEFVDARLKAPLRHFAELQSEAAQDAAHA